MKSNCTVKNSAITNRNTTMDTKALRQKILDLAIHGKLVPQDPNDEPASVLLERIKAEKERLIKEGKIKRSKKSAKTSDTPHYENVPFEVPEGWVWCKLDDLAFYKKGPFGSSLTKAMFVPKGDDTYKVYEQKNAIQKDHELGSYYISKEKYCSLIGFSVHPYDIIVSCAGTIGETYVLPQNIQEGIINQALMLMRLYNREIERFYLLYFDFILKQEAYKESKGTAIKNIPPFDVLKNFFIPIPPKNEQIRILEEVDKWITFADAIETNSNDLQTIIKQTKSKILDLAIHGKLVPQDPNDEPAIELLKRINPDFTPCDNGHYTQLPEGWTVCRLEQVADILDNLRKPINASERESRIKNRQIDELYPYYGATGQVGLIDDYVVNGHYLLLGEDGAPFLDKNAIKAYSISGKSWVNNHAHILSPKIDFEFLQYSLNQIDYSEYVNGSTRLKLTQTDMRSIIIMLPPLAEQKRIRFKIRTLFSQLDLIMESL